MGKLPYKTEVCGEGVILFVRQSFMCVSHENGKNIRAVTDALSLNRINPDTNSPATSIGSIRFLWGYLFSQFDLNSSTRQVKHDHTFLSKTGRSYIPDEYKPEPRMDSESSFKFVHSSGVYPNPAFALVRAFSSPSRRWRPMGRKVCWRVSVGLGQG